MEIKENVHHLSEVDFQDRVMLTYVWHKNSQWFLKYRGVWWCCCVDVNSGFQPCSWKWAKPNKERSESQTVREKHSLLILHPHEFDQNWFNYNGPGSLDTPGGTGESLLSAPNVITQMEDLGLLILDSVLQSDLGQAASPETFSMFHLNRALPGGGGSMANGCYI